MSFLWEALWLSDLFSGTGLEVTPLDRFWRKMARMTWIHARTDVTFAVKIETFCNPWPTDPQYRQNLPNLVGNGNVCSISRLTLEVSRANTPYSSSEPNKTVILNRQCESEKLKYVPNFCIGVQVTWYRACAMTIQPVSECKRGLGSNISKTVRRLVLVTMEHGHQ